MSAPGPACPAGSARGGRAGTPATEGTDLLGHGDPRQTGRGLQKSCRFFPCTGAACNLGAEFTAWGEETWVTHSQGSGDGGPRCLGPTRESGDAPGMGLCGPNSTPTSAAVGASTSHDGWDAAFTPPCNKS